MPDRPRFHLVVLSSTRLQREAWRALLSAQPGVVVSGVVGEIPALADLPRLGEPATILVDLPDPRPEFTRRLKEIRPDLGSLFLVRTYEIAEILPLLRAGAAGCVSRDDSVGDLARAIIAAGRGDSFETLQKALVLRTAVGGPATR